MLQECGKLSQVKNTKSKWKEKRGKKSNTPAGCLTDTYGEQICELQHNLKKKTKTNTIIGGRGKWIALPCTTRLPQKRYTLG